MPRSAYSPLAMLFHWTIALLFAGQVALGLAMMRVSGLRLQFELIQWHKSFGFLILGLGLMRIAQHLLQGRPPPLPETSPVERRAARLVHAALLAATVAVPFAGWALASASTLAIPTFVFNLVVIPHLPTGSSPGTEAFWRNAHVYLAYAAALLAACHAAAALYHHVVRRDDTLRRMLPGATTGAGRGSAVHEKEDDNA